MDIVKFWSDQVTAWNDSEKCGFCWAFGAPLEEQTTNIHQLKDDSKCCVQVFLTDPTFGEKPLFSPSTGFVNDIEQTESFTLWVLLPSKLGQNNWNEITGYDTDESRWHTIFEPLRKCVNSTTVIDACTILGYKVDVLKWEGRLVVNYQDMNYAGWRINGTFRVKA